MIELKEDDQRAVEAMLRFMYGCDRDSGINYDGPISPMLFNTEVYKVADKYRVSALTQLSKRRIQDDFPRVIRGVYGPSQCQKPQETIAHISHEQMKVLQKKDSFLRVLQETSGFAADLVLLQAKAITSQTSQISMPQLRWTVRSETSRCKLCCLICGTGRLESDLRLHLL
ncbi:uncharacterized protein Z519_05608 [Cladophialophora bantiana CBS 173.52]|uniref:BTB domain-containing protein n=1 Tax=Cladophialophora bantiana (strain ATCC 10958 / CBS 173.52 / CDC B-1940 / NIH 8579) TaxID=1442370 RepID=A0A0D2G6Q2_CLAB1|nr:uncharacterized protein Z519_05608 [Cladophialophora bantiana CBS 173.52]KIW94292.1 hypothetical protein Z519_05608 [Cladophialophora bantiana CBS 173.52]